MLFIFVAICQLNFFSTQHNDNLDKDILDFDYRSSALLDCLSTACMDDGC